MFGFLRRRPKHERSFKYRRCPNCNACDWRPGGNGEVTERWGRMYVRQYHKCLNCGLRINLIRNLDSRIWSRSEHEAILTD